METLNLKIDLEPVRKVFETYGFYNVTNEEIETVIRATLTQYVKEGWVGEVLTTELRQLREDPTAYKQEAEIA